MSPRRCQCCGGEAHVDDIDYVGVQALEEPETPLLLANHSCGTTLAFALSEVLHDDGGLR